MKTKIEQAKSILSLNNKELSKLLGHHERYIDRVLREGVSLAQEKVIIKDIDAFLKMHDLEQHKRYMKRKLHDKSLVINWLLALNVFFILFLFGKCVGLV